MIHREPKIFASGFAPKLGGNEHLPYSIERSAYGNVPVYVDLRQGGQQVRTVLKGVRGDVAALCDALRAAFPADRPVELKVKVSSIELRGNHAAFVKHWLLQMGF